MRQISATAVLAAASVLAIAAPSAATTCSSVAACLLGNNTGSGVGAEGVSQQNVGLYGVSTLNHGIDGRSRQSYGVVGYTYARDVDRFAGVYGIDSTTQVNSNNSGVLGVSTFGVGVIGRGVQGVEGDGSNAGLAAFGPNYGAVLENYSTTSQTLVLINEDDGPVLEASSNGNRVVSIDSAGNEILAGSLTESGTPMFRTKTARGDVASYGSRSASPTLEDFGTAQLHDGIAFVALEPTFASTIDQRSYMVFITPQGNSNGLYAVTTAAGFKVRENNGGRATLGFDYRIVAKPLDSIAARLPAMAPPKRADMPKFLSIRKIASGR